MSECKPQTGLTQYLYMTSIEEARSQPSIASRARSREKEQAAALHNT